AVDDHGAAGVVHTLAQQVLTEPPLLALEHVRQRLQRAVARSGDRTAAPAVVEQGVHRFLQHALLVVHDDLGGTEIQQPLEPVVAVDHATVQIVEVGGREAAPSSCTIGRRSGGITGTQSSTMPSGELVVVRKAETTLSRLSARAFFWPLPVAMTSRRASASASRSKSRRRCWSASAPMPRST